MNKKSFILIFIFILVIDISFIYGQVDQGKSKEAESFLRKCIDSLKMGNADKAVEYAEKAVALKNNVSKYYQYLGYAYVLKARTLPVSERIQYIKKIVSAFETAVKFDCNNTDARIRLASLYIELPVNIGGSLEKAKEQAVEILKSKPLPAHTLLSMIYLKENDIDKGEKSAEEACKLHLDFKKKHPNKHSGFNPEILNDYGYKFINRGDIDKAIKLFKMNVEAFPGYFNVYDSLAEAYMIKGDKERAIKYYEKSLELNPGKTEFEKRTYKQTLDLLVTLKKEKDPKK